MIFLFLFILLLVIYMYYINCFFIYSIIGYLFESIVGVFRKTGFSSGVLYGPWTPIYGVGVNLILFLSYYFFKNLHFVWWREVCIVFFVVMFSLTLIEWLGGILIENFFHVIFWNYEDFQYHIGKYIALEVSLLWGVLSLVLIYVVHPLIQSFILKIPHVITYGLIVLMLIDYIFTFIKYKYKN